MEISTKVKITLVSTLYLNATHLMASEDAIPVTIYSDDAYPPY
ncbi:TPA: ABC transporter substrate-binding protein, partial [Vibrio vulnificus]|nr:ABC transporter substrate-binding protein [Vibrio vulnificus]